MRDRQLLPISVSATDGVITLRTVKSEAKCSRDTMSKLVSFVDAHRKCTKQILDSIASPFNVLI
jgi:hypothetical protein